MAVYDCLASFLAAMGLVSMALVQGLSCETFSAQTNNILKYTIAILRDLEDECLIPCTRSDMSWNLSFFRFLI